MSQTAALGLAGAVGAVKGNRLVQHKKLAKLFGAHGAVLGRAKVAAAVAGLLVHVDVLGVGLAVAVVVAVSVADFGLGLLDLFGLLGLGGGSSGLVVGRDQGDGQGEDDRGGKHGR